MAIRCPLCNQSMVTVNVGPVEIDVCKLGCKGIWFDAHELQQLVLPTRNLEAALADAFNAKPRFRGNQTIKCPRCAWALKPTPYGPAGVVIDFCYGCGGYFLDAGELKAIQDARSGKAAAPPVRMGGAVANDLEPAGPPVRKSWEPARLGAVQPPRRPGPLPLSRNVVLQENIIDAVFLGVALVCKPFGYGRYRGRRSPPLSKLFRSLF